MMVFKCRSTEFGQPHIIREKRPQCMVVGGLLHFLQELQLNEFPWKLGQLFETPIG